MKASRLAALIAAGVIGLGILAQTTAHIVVGERLLYRAHSEIEYLPQPDQVVLQRDVLMRTNAWGMRSFPIEEQKPYDAFRVLVIGDSVVFGHTNIPHGGLATSKLSEMRTEDGKRVEALNVSAPSWGPGNMLAWLDEFGTLEADAIGWCCRRTILKTIARSSRLSAGCHKGDRLQRRWTGS